MPAVRMSATVVRPLLLGLYGAGIEPGPIFQQAGLPLEQAEDPAAEVPFEAVRRLWLEVPQSLGDERFGLHIAERAARSPGGLPLGLLEHLVRITPCMGAAMKAVMDFARLDCSAARVALTEEDGAAHLLQWYEGLPAPLPPAAHEWVVAYWVLLGRQATGVPWRPRWVQLQHEAPADRGEHDRVFGCPVRFGAPANGVVFDRELLDLPLPGAAPDLARILAAFATVQVERLGGESDAQLTERLREVVREGLAEGRPQLDHVARQLAMSPRTLERRLQSEGTSFQRIIDEVRDEQALACLRGQMPIPEIAERLGFSEPSAFYRWFRGRHALTPAAYRQGCR